VVFNANIKITLFAEFTAEKKSLLKSMVTELAVFPVTFPEASTGAGRNQISSINSSYNNFFDRIIENYF